MVRVSTAAARQARVSWPASAGHSDFAKVLRRTLREDREECAPSTAREYKYVIKNHFDAALWRDAARCITSGQMNQFSASLLDRYSKATANAYATVLTVLISYAIEFDCLLESPLKKRVKKHKADNRATNYRMMKRHGFLPPLTIRSVPSTSRACDATSRIGGHGRRDVAVRWPSCMGCRSAL